MSSDQRESPFSAQEGSPTSFLSPHEHSEISINESISQKHIRNIRQPRSDSKEYKKQLKFDNIFEDTPLDLNSGSLQFQLGSGSSDDGEFNCLCQDCSPEACIQGLKQVFSSSTFSTVYLLALVLFLANSVLEAAEIGAEVETATLYVDFACQLFFSLTIALKFLNWEQQDWLSVGLDVVTNLAGYVAFGMGIQEAQQSLRYFRAVKTLRVLLIIKESMYLKIPANNLLNSLKSVGKILFPAALFLYFYAVIGLYSFRDFEFQKCRDPSNKYLSADWSVYSEEIHLCGEKACPTVNGTEYECLNPVFYGVAPSEAETVNIAQGNGLMKYSHIGYSLFSTVKQVFVTGSSRLINLQKQATNKYFVLVYYLSFIYLLSYIYLNIFYGLMMSSEEEKVHEEVAKADSNFQLQISRSSAKKQTLKAVKSRRSSKVSAEIKLKDFSAPKKGGLSQEETKLETEPRLIKQSSSSKSSSSILKRPLDNHSSSDKREDGKLKEIAEQGSNKSEFEEVIDFKPKNYDPNQLCQEKRFGKYDQIDETCSSAFSHTFHWDEDEIQELTLKYSYIMHNYFVFNHIVVALCSFNILLDYEGQPASFVEILDIVDFGFYVIYALEIVFRVYVYRKYLPLENFDRALKLDISLFVCCTVGMAYEGFIADGFYDFIVASESSERIFRTLKYIRLVLLLSSTPFFKELRIIFNSTFETVYSVRYFIALWFLILVVMSVMGYHMFESKTKVDSSGALDLENGSPFDISFEGIRKSIIFTVYAFFNEEWDYFMFQQYLGSGVLIVIWQLFSLLVGLQIMSKYFMALLMKELGDKLDEEENLAEELAAEDDFPEDEEISVNVKKEMEFFASNKVQPFDSNAITSKDPDFNQPQRRRVSFSQRNGMIEIFNASAAENVRASKSRKNTRLKSLIEDDKSDEEDSHSQKVNSKKIGEGEESESNQPGIEGNDDREQHLGLLQRIKNKFRAISKSSIYVYLRVVMIGVNIVCSILDHPQLDPDTQERVIYQRILLATTIFFGVEMALTMATFGLVEGRHAYFRKYMNYVYLGVLVIEVLEQFVGDNHAIEALLVARVFRMYIVVELKYHADRDMRLTIVGFWKLFPKIANLLAMTLIMYAFFAIVLVKLYKEDFYYCEDADPSATVLTKEDCLSWGGHWLQRQMNVSNIFSSLLYLFLVATTEGWSNEAAQAASLRGLDSEPQYGAAPLLEYFFSGFFFFGNMVMLNVFIGLSVYNLKKIKEQVTGEAKLSADNKMWLSIKNQIYRLRPNMKDSPPDNCLSVFCHRIKHGKCYKRLNVVMFVLFMVNMSLYQTDMSDLHEQILDVIVDIFIAFFLFEYVISWVSLGTRVTKSPKFGLETISTLYMIMLFISNQTLDLTLKESRILYGLAISLLAIRYFALLNDIEFVRKMINSLITIFPITSNIWLLVAITLTTYATIGIELFSYLKIGTELNEFDQNYTNFTNAIYALIKFSILESPITQILDASTTLQPNSVCFDMYDYDDFTTYGRMGCGGWAQSLGFFLSFQLVYSLILMSTLMAVIFDAYSEVRREEESMVNKFQLEEVRNQWTEYDPEATGYICYRDFWMFTAKLVKIYNVNNESLMSHETKHSFLKSLDIPIYEDESGVLSFQFHEVIEALTRIVVKQKQGAEFNTNEADKMFKFKQRESNFKVLKRSFYDSSHVLTLIILKSGIKKWKRKACKSEEGEMLQNLFVFAKKEKEKNAQNKSGSGSIDGISKKEMETQSMNQKSKLATSEDKKSNFASPAKNQAVRGKGKQDSSGRSPPSSVRNQIQPQGGDEIEEVQIDKQKNPPRRPLRVSKKSTLRGKESSTSLAMEASKGKNSNTELNDKGLKVNNKPGNDLSLRNHKLQADDCQEIRLGEVNERKGSERRNMVEKQQRKSKMSSVPQSANKTNKTLTSPRELEIIPLPKNKVVQNQIGEDSEPSDLSVLE